MHQPAKPKTSRLVFALALTLCSFPSVLAQGSYPPPPATDDKPFISDENFAAMAQQTRELKDASCRAFMRARLIGLTTAADNADRRQAALSVATEALSDLVANQSDVWRAQPFWLHQQVIAAVKNFDPVEAELLAGKFKLKQDERDSDAAQAFSEFSEAVRMMRDPGKASTGAEKAKAAILTGKLSAASLMGQFLQMQHSDAAGMAPLLSATLTLEDQKPGFFPLQLLPFLSGVFLDKSVPADIQASFISTTVRRTRLSPEEMANPISRSQVVSALNQILEAAKSYTPALYPEVASRLSTLAPADTARRAQLQASEERIKTSSDQLEQMQTEADRTSDSNYRTSLLTRAARLALTQGKLRKAVDLACAGYGDAPSNSSYLDSFLASVISAAATKKEPDAIVYAVSMMAKPLSRANGFIALATHYATARDAEKTAAALRDAAGALKDAENSNEKLRSEISLAKGFVEYDGAATFEAFRHIVDTINKLPPAEKQKEKTVYVPFPTIDELIRSFRTLAALDESGAFAMAQDIKTAEMRIAALSGIYSHPRILTK